MRRSLIFAIVFCMLTANWVYVRAQTPDSKYFSETGHNVKGEFLKFYSNNPNAVFLYGYPITEEFTNTDNVLIQYFQRARFEYRPGMPEGQRVQLTKVGSDTFVSTGPLNVNNAFSCRNYVETGYSVCYSFLEFFDQYGGLSQFGYPISSFEYHENKLVQYFQNARLEWQPWMPEGQRVAVSNLGRIYFNKLGEDPGLLPPVKPIDNSVSSVISLQVRAFVWKAVTLASDSQTIFVVVQDQNMQPVANANCTATLHWPDERIETMALATNVKGVGFLPLTFVDQPYGSLVFSDVACTYNNLKAVTTASFRIWY